MDSQNLDSCLSKEKFSSYKPVSYIISQITGLEVQNRSDLDKSAAFWVRVHGSHSYTSGDRYNRSLQWAKYVRDDLSDIRNNFMRLGFHLSEIQEYGYHLGLDFYNYIETQFNICRSTATKLIAVYRRFSDKGRPVVEKRYENYSYSQLENMLPIPDAKHIDINPTMTVAQIKAYSQSLKAPAKLADIREVQAVSAPVVTKAADDCDFCNGNVMELPEVNQVTTDRPIRDSSVGRLKPVADWYRDMNDRVIGNMVGNLCAWFGNDALDYDTAFELLFKSLTDKTVVDSIKFFVERYLNS